MYHHCTFKNLHLNQSFLIGKQNYVYKIAQRLGDPNARSKCYWSLSQTTLNGKKIPCIPPLFHVDEYIIEFQEKKVRFSILFSLTNVLRLQTEVSCLLNYRCVQIAYYLFVTLQKRTSFE